jgi:beta-lactam-binding protein with PASTA domain/tRNA A-37 threonylcarbamoyl transferase component Bud32
VDTLTDPLVGALLDGRYRVQGRVARGGMATVYTAVDIRLDRKVAVKVMHPALADDEAFVARFIREARAAARLSHPNVVPVYDQGADAGSVFLVMEYVAGRTLRDLLHEHGRLSPGQALDVLEPVLAALEAAHLAGLVHRDVKPENVLLADDGRIKVADFGLARAVEAANLTATAGLLMGTVGYLAPEQVERGGSDPRSDVYAAGILLYELLTGAPPYVGETALAVAYRHVHEDVPPPSAVVPSVPPALDALVRRATRRDPADRFPSASAFRASLLRAGGGRGRDDVVDLRDTAVVPLVDSAGGRAGGSVAVAAPRRRRGRQVAAAVLALLVAVAAGAGWWFGAGRYTSVPALVKLPGAAAVAKVEQAGLAARFAPEVFSSTVPAGAVVEESPGAGRRLVRGQPVTLALSKGPESYAVPQLASAGLAAATARLAELKLRAVKGPAEYSTVPVGSVVRTSPQAGTTLAPGSDVTLVLSRGPRPVAVPPVTGRDVREATALLRTAGLQVATTEAYSDTVAKDLVIAADRRTAVPGSTVTLQVSRGPQLFAVPDQRDVPVRKARATLIAAGFRVEVISVPFGPGRVLAQSPPGNSMAAHGTTVTLSVF